MMIKKKLTNKLIKCLIKMIKVKGVYNDFQRKQFK